MIFKMYLLIIHLVLLSTCLVKGIDFDTLETSTIDGTLTTTVDNDLIPREDILNHALASAEMALKHVKENWIPLFDENAILDDPTGSHEFKGMI